MAASIACHGKGEGELSPTCRTQQHTVSTFHDFTTVLCTFVKHFVRPRITSACNMPEELRYHVAATEQQCHSDQRAEQSRQSVAWNRDAFRCTQPTACSRLRGWLNSKFKHLPICSLHIAFCRRVHRLCEAQSHCIRKLIRFQADATFGGMSHSQTLFDVFALFLSLHFLWSLHCLRLSRG